MRMIISKKHIIIVVFVAYLSLLGCDKNYKPISHKDNIVLIFSNYPENININILENDSKIVSLYDIHYLNDSLYPEYYTIKVNKDSDTLHINTKRNYIEILHNYNAINEANYLFERGDTVIFSYKDNQPYAEVINRKDQFLNVNYDIKFNYKDSIPIEVRFRHPYLFNNREIITKKKLYISLINQYESEKRILDSLHKSNLITENSLHYRSKNLITKIYILHKQDTSINIGNTLINLLSDTATIFQNNDSLLYYKYFRDILAYKLESSLDFIPMIKGQGFSSPNYKTRFDKILKSVYLSDNAKRYFLLKELDMIFKESDVYSIEEYGNRFKLLFGDTIAIRKLKDKYEVDLSQKDDLFLKDIRDNKFTLNEILEKHIGSVIYIDFWASWCAPCRRSFPHSRKLYSEYKNKNVVILYFAKDDTKENWMYACEEENILENSYFITNSKTSSYLYELDVTTIPRYVIYDTIGELIHKNAPAPDSKEVRYIFNKLLTHF